ncbi:hypothetical protein PHLGIDRAFT_36911 [Phlebiopsis gigantea 11061_1 CR5-6]|uniref:Uncharacterized protein n=1 Tax=Phlebiopsis gigantea (strain 11061_1 CR5-6) TaxID=745531 RepID=A0A0C3S3K6_PHLG1|nr:hypothetical protein PHLGIDRAFT_36911 [Phlebiopsis gigantea 11061_1 CR5-6]
MCQKWKTLRKELGHPQTKHDTWIAARVREHEDGLTPKDSAKSPSDVECLFEVECTEGAIDGPFQDPPTFVLYLTIRGLASQSGLFASPRAIVEKYEGAGWVDSPCWVLAYPELITHVVYQPRELAALEFMRIAYSSCNRAQAGLSDEMGEWARRAAVGTSVHRAVEVEAARLSRLLSLRPRRSLRATERGATDNLLSSRSFLCSQVPAMPYTIACTSIQPI